MPEIEMVVVEPYAGSLWRAPSCPLCGRTMAMHRSAIVTDTPPTYGCEQHGNADMVFLIASDPKPAFGTVGVPYNTVLALPVHRYEAITTVVPDA